MSAGGRVSRVKNKAPAPVQITAEQLLREAAERQEAEFQPPKQLITDPEELAEHRFKKRKEFEDEIRRERSRMSTWMNYAKWEESQRDLRRARSVFERAIDEDYRHTGLWLKYAEMEMQNKMVNRARNVWDRAVTLLPRVNQFWYKYVFMEEMLGNFAGARQILERWMKFEPDVHAWHAYIKFELRHGEVELARNVYERFVLVHPTVPVWLKYTKFEEKNGEIESARSLYARAIEELGEEAHHEDERLFVAFAKFEEGQKEFERARTIYKYALDHVPKNRAEELFKTFVAFEKRHGDRLGIEEVIAGKRRFQYEEEIKRNPTNYDVWFDYIRLEEGNGDRAKIEEVYERAIGNKPPVTDKRFWRRYIYLWLNYALYEELEAQDFEKTRDVFKEILQQIPHKLFSFSKMWVMYAQFEIRQKNLVAARTVLGHAIGMAPKEKIFKAYINLEHMMGNIDRCRTLYEKYVEFNPANVQAWTSFAELEQSLGELDRCRGIYELAIDQPVLDMPEALWKSYIDFEIANEEEDNARLLYRRLLQRTKHVKVWLSFAEFESERGNNPKAREIYEQAYTALKHPDLLEQRVMLVEAWKEFEDAVGEEQAIADVSSKMPRKVKRRRRITTEDGSDAGWEEYYDYIFPDDKGAQPNLKLLEMAHKWKKQKVSE